MLNIFFFSRRAYSQETVLQNKINFKIRMCFGLELLHKGMNHSVSHFFCCDLKQHVIFLTRQTKSWQNKNF